MRTVIFGLAGAAVAALSMLAPIAAAAPRAAPQSAAAPVAAGTSVPDSYKLGPGDQLAMIVIDEPQLTGNFTIGGDGTLALPWVGEVPARGRTVGQLRTEIETRLRAGFIVKPGVGLQVLVCRPFFILGEVNKPGQYPYVYGLTARAAIAAAGGFTYRANMRKLFIRREGATVEDKLPLDADTPVAPGDILRIPESWF